MRTHLHELVHEFLVLLKKEEQSDSGTNFRPNHINSCRVMDGIRLGELIEEMEYIVGLSD